MSNTNSNNNNNNNGCGAKKSLSELVLSAVFYLQRNNPVSVMEIAEYVAKKRCCNVCQIRGTIKFALTKGKDQGILSESKGMYKIEVPYEDKVDKSELKPPAPQSDEEPQEDDDDVPEECVAMMNDCDKGCCPEGAASEDCLVDDVDKPEDGEEGAMSEMAVDELNAILSGEPSAKRMRTVGKDNCG